MKIMSSQSWWGSLSLVLFFSSCTVIRTAHPDPVDVGLIKNKGEGHITAYVDANDETAGLGGSFLISPADNFLVGAGFGTYTYKIFNRSLDLFDILYDVDRDAGQLSGYKGRLNAGFYKNFGPSGTHYIEAMLTATSGRQDLQLSFGTNDTSFMRIRYNPYSIGIQFAAGKNRESLRFLGGIKGQAVFFGKDLPLVRTRLARESSPNSFFLQWFFNARFGKGPVKANVQCSLGYNITAILYTASFDPITSLSLGIQYNFGRKKTTEFKL